MRPQLPLLALVALAGASCAPKADRLLGYWTLGDPRASNRYPLWHFEEGGALSILNPIGGSEPGRNRYTLEGNRLDVKFSGRVPPRAGRVRWIGNETFEVEGPDWPGVSKFTKIEPTGSELAAAVQATTDPGAGLSDECVEKVTKIARAALLYSEDHDARLPLADHWMDLTLPYLGGGPDGFRCPAVRMGYGYEFSPKMSGAAVTREDQQNERSMFHDSPNLRWNARGDLVVNGPRHDSVAVLGTVNGTAVKVPIRSVRR